MTNSSKSAAETTPTTSRRLAGCDRALDLSAPSLTACVNSMSPVFGNATPHATETRPANGHTASRKDTIAVEYPEPATAPYPKGPHFVNLQGRAVLLAMDGSEGALAAVHIALALANTCHAVVHVLSVVDTRSAPMPPPLDLALAMGDAIAGEGVHDKQVEELRRELTAATRHPIDWPIAVTLGKPSVAIVREARRVGAALIVVGLRHHNRVDRLVNDETALNVMRNADCPVLAVVPGMNELPKRVLSAMDFSSLSLVALRTARAIVGERSVFTLAYVAPEGRHLTDDGESAIHECGVEAGFAKLTRELGDEGMKVDHVVLHHELPRTPAEMILEHAEVSRPDLISVGSARHGRLERWMVGSVSTDLVRDGRYSMLVVPPLAVAG